MNPIDENMSPPDDDRRFDRLADGELSQGERRDLLSQLDVEPHGWRRCALAFLEAQGWRKELGAIARPRVDRRDPPSAFHLPPSPPSPRRGWRSPLGAVLAVAASFLVAFILGMHVRGGPATPGSGGPAIDSQLAAGTGGAPGSEPWQARKPDAPRPAAVPADRWQVVTLNAPQGPEGETTTVRLPAVERNTLDEQWLQTVPMAVPEDVLAELKRNGLEVRQHREILPMEMQDGRRLVVPMDRVEVHYVGRPAM
jgi:hypothetical protein